MSAAPPAWTPPPPAPPLRPDEERTWLVLGILAAVAASRWECWEWYRYPATPRLVT